VWRQVCNAELGPGVDPEALLRTSLDEVALPEAVGLLTSCALAPLRRRAAQRRRAGRALRGDHRLVERAGRRRSARARCSTAWARSTCLCQLSQPLEEGALVETCALVAEARTAALARGERPEPSHRPSRHGHRHRLHRGGRARGRRRRSRDAACATWASIPPAGALVGAAVREACTRGITRWLAEYGA